MSIAFMPDTTTFLNQLREADDPVQVLLDDVHKAYHAGDHEGARKILDKVRRLFSNGYSTASFRDYIFDAQDFVKIKSPERRFLLNGILRENQISMISAARGIGKTWVGSSIADAITRGISWGPWKSEHSAPCLILDGEMDSGDTKEQLLLLNPTQEREYPLYIYSDALMNQNGCPRANLLNEDWRATMKEALVERKVKVFIIDNIASLAPGIDENSKEGWDPINQWLIDLRFAGISSILLHHTNKSGGQRGTSAREDNIDMSIQLRRPPGYKPEHGVDFILSFTKSRVSSEYLHLLREIRFVLRSEDGISSWDWSYLKLERKKAILRMLDEGQEPKEIHETLDVTKSAVSHAKTDAIKKGYLSKADGKLTPAGWLYVNN